MNGGASARAVVLAEVHEARGNLQSLRGKDQMWEAKLARCPELEDFSGGTNASEKVLEGMRRRREAQRVVEELEGKMVSIRGGRGSRKSDILLTTPPRAKLKKKGGFWGGLRGFFVAWCYCPREGPPAPRNSPHPPMKYIVSGTSEQLGMWPKCDLTIRTAPTNVYGRVSSAWVFPAVGTGNFGIVGL